MESSTHQSLALKATCISQSIPSSAHKTAYEKHGEPLEDDIPSDGSVDVSLSDCDNVFKDLDHMEPDLSEQEIIKVGFTIILQTDLNDVPPNIHEDIAFYVGNKHV